MSQLSVHAVHGAAISPYLDAIAQLRMRVFREYPYLYEGSVDYERDYLATYVACDYAVVVLAESQGQVVGASTGLPLAYADSAFQTPFRSAGYEVDSVYYCAESVLLPAYRGCGMGHAFFDYREQDARRLGCSMSTFCAVARACDHPLRPETYRPLDRFWQRRGYGKSDLVARFHWQDIDAEEETEKCLNFWLKSLDET